MLRGCWYCSRNTMSADPTLRGSNYPIVNSNSLEEENGISSYLAAFAQTASFSVSQAPFCIAAAPLLLTKVSGQCCEAIIQTAVRSPLLPLFAIAARMSAMCEAAAVAPSANTATETFLSEESSISGLFNLLLWTVTVMMPMLVASKLFRVDEVNDSYSNQYVYVKSVDGRYIVIPFHPLKTIGMLKCEIERKLQLLPKRYSLHAYSWKRLDRDSLSLSDYGICNGSTLVTNIPMCGGAGKEETSKTHVQLGEAGGGARSSDGSSRHRGGSSIIKSSWTQRKRGRRRMQRGAPGTPTWV